MQGKPVTDFPCTCGYERLLCFTPFTFLITFRSGFLVKTHHMRTGQFKGKFRRPESIFFRMWSVTRVQKRRKLLRQMHSVPTWRRIDTYCTLPLVRRQGRPAAEEPPRRDGVILAPQDGRRAQQRQRRKGSPNQVNHLSR